MTVERSKQRIFDGMYRYLMECGIGVLTVCLIQMRSLLRYEPYAFSIHSFPRYTKIQFLILCLRYNTDRSNSR